MLSSTASVTATLRPPTQELAGCRLRRSLRCAAQQRRPQCGAPHGVLFLDDDLWWTTPGGTHHSLTLSSLYLDGLLGFVASRSRS